MIHGGIVVPTDNLVARILINLPSEMTNDRIGYYSNIIGHTVVHYSNLHGYQTNIESTRALAKPYCGLQVLLARLGYHVQIPTYSRLREIPFREVTLSTSIDGL